MKHCRSIFSLMFLYSIKGLWGQGPCPPFGHPQQQHSFWHIGNSQWIFCWMNKLMQKIAFELVIFRIGVWECEWNYDNLLITFFAKSLFKALNKRHFIERYSPAANTLSACFLWLGTCTNKRWEDCLVLEGKPCSLWVFLKLSSIQGTLKMTSVLSEK